MFACRAAALFLCLALACAAWAAPQESELALKRDGRLVGTLLFPEGQARVPVVLLVAGSGATDRNGNQIGMFNDSLRQLAHALGEAGIASLRYDKRGVASSMAAATREADLTIDTFADDAAAWMRRLKADGRFDRLVVVGHSEGALVGMLAAGKGGADGFVSLAGPGQRLSAVLRRQLAGKLPPALLQESERILAALEAGRRVEQVAPQLAVLFRPSVQPFLVSLFRYDPAAQFAALTMPAAVMQGSTDLQVGVEDARRLAAARPGAPLAIVPGMNHVLKMAQGDLAAQLPSYTRTDLPLSEELVAELVTFIRALR